MTMMMTMMMMYDMVIVVINTCRPTKQTEDVQVMVFLGSIDREGTTRGIFDDASLYARRAVVTIHYQLSNIVYLLPEASFFFWSFSSYSASAAFSLPKEGWVVVK